LFCVAVEHYCLEDGEVTAYSHYITVFFIFQQPLEYQSGWNVEELTHDTEGGELELAYFCNIHREDVLVLVEIWRDYAA